MFAFGCTFLAFLNPFEKYGWTPQVWPVVLLATIVAFLINPLPVFHREVRYWFLKCLKCLVLSPFYKVEFSYFFLGDQMVSNIYSFTMIYLFGCSYANHWEPGLDKSCRVSTSWVVSIIMILPPFWRLMQCFRRYYDTKMANPHLLNSIKYGAQMLTTLISFAFKRSDEKGVLALWFIVATLTAIYASWWDYCKDWGLLQPGSKNRFLRDDLLYRKWWYYVALATNFPLRMMWLITISYGGFQITTNMRLIVLIAAILEIFRRIQWNIFRVENEQSNNCGMFRAVKDVPLPFEIRKDRFDEEEEENSNSSRARGKNSKSDTDDEDDSSGNEKKHQLRFIKQKSPSQIKKIMSLQNMELNLDNSRSPTGMSLREGDNEGPSEVGYFNYVTSNDGNEGADESTDKENRQRTHRRTSSNDTLSELMLQAKEQTRNWSRARATTITTPSEIPGQEVVTRSSNSSPSKKITAKGSFHVRHGSTMQSSTMDSNVNKPGSIRDSNASKKPNKKYGIADPLSVSTKTSSVYNDKTTPISISKFAINKSAPKSGPPSINYKGDDYFDQRNVTPRRKISRGESQIDVASIFQAGRDYESGRSFRDYTANTADVEMHNFSDDEYDDESSEAESYTSETHNPTEQTPFGSQKDV